MSTVLAHNKDKPWLNQKDCREGIHTFYIIIIDRNRNRNCGVKEFDHLSPLYNRPKAHADEEEMLEDEWKKSKFPSSIAEDRNRDYRGEERHAIKGRLVEHPKKKDKYYGSAMRAWWRSNSRRNYHLRIKCPQLTFWPYWWGNDSWIVLLWLLQLTEGLGRRVMGQAFEKWPTWSTNGGLRSTKMWYIM